MNNPNDKRETLNDEPAVPHLAFSVQPLAFADDGASARARAEVEKLTELVRQNPDDEYYRMCLREWLKELAHPTRYQGEERR